MTLWLRMALVSEGVSDDAFLAPILRRSVRERGPTAMRLDEVLPLRAARGPAPHEAVMTQLLENAGAFNLVVVHHDGGSDPGRARCQWVDPIRQSWQEAGQRDAVLGVIPVRESEAWALADPAALAMMLGRPRAGEPAGLPTKAADLERLPDPKQTLRELFERGGRWDPKYLARLGELVSLDRVRELPAFRRWEDDLDEALQTLPGFTKR